MSALELVLVPMAIIVGFGISEVLGGWGGQIRNRHRCRPYPLQIAGSALILFFCLAYLWGLWQLADIAWTFPLYLLIACPALALALAAHVTRIEMNAESDSAEQYFRNSSSVYPLLAVIPAVVVVLSFVSEARAQIPSPPSLLGITLLRVIAIGLLVFLAWSKNARHHASALSILWLAVFGMTIRIAFRLD